MRRLRLFVAVLLLAALAVPISTPTASAQDAYCARRGPYSTSKRYDLWLLNFSWHGVTTWVVNPTVTAWDLCDHGGISLAVNLWNASAKGNGGDIGVQVDLMIYGQNRWLNLQLVPRSPAGTGWYTFTKDIGVGGLGHLDLCRSCRIQYLRFMSTIWGHPSGANWTPLAQRVLVLNLMAPSWTSN